VLPFHRPRGAVIMRGVNAYKRLPLGNRYSIELGDIMIKGSVVAGLMLAAASAANAGGALDVSLADEAVRLAYDATQAGSGMHVNLSGLHHTHEGNIIGAGLHAVDMRNRNPNLFIGVGAKLFAFETGDLEDSNGDAFTGSALAVGGFFRYRIPVQPDFSLAAYAYYAPPVVSFGDADNFINTDWRVQYNLIPAARIYGGYRYNSINLEGVRKDYELGEGWHVGLTMDF
jgi:hypothetical protein